MIDSHDFHMTSAIDEAELLVFLCDLSGSMYHETTYNKNKKIDHLIDILDHTVLNLRSSSKAENFRLIFKFFSETFVRRPETAYCHINEAGTYLQNPYSEIPASRTAIADTLDSVVKDLDYFAADEGLPEDKHATVFLFTDGAENCRGESQQEYQEAVITAANRVKSHRTTPFLATVSFGLDADEKLLIEIANKLTTRQYKHLEIAGVLEYVVSKNKGYIQGHAGGSLSEDISMAIRNFLNVLSTTE